MFNTFQHEFRRGSLERFRYCRSSSCSNAVVLTKRLSAHHKAGYHRMPLNDTNSHGHQSISPSNGSSTIEIAKLYCINLYLPSTAYVFVIAHSPSSFRLCMYRCWTTTTHNDCRFWRELVRELQGLRTTVESSAREYRCEKLGDLTVGFRFRPPRLPSGP